jgi:hypothetical protein
MRGSRTNSLATNEETLARSKRSVLDDDDAHAVVLMRSSSSAKPCRVSLDRAHGAGATGPAARRCARSRASWGGGSGTAGALLSLGYIGQSRGSSVVTLATSPSMTVAPRSRECHLTSSQILASTSRTHTANHLLPHRTKVPPTFRVGGSRHSCTHHNCCRRLASLRREPIYNYHRDGRRAQRPINAGFADRQELTWPP